MFCLLGFLVQLLNFAIIQNILNAILHFCFLSVYLQLVGMLLRVDGRNLQLWRERDMRGPLGHSAEAALAHRVRTGIRRPMGKILELL